MQRPVCCHNVLMFRSPKALIAILMTLALFMQASAGCVCAVGCMMGTCGVEQAQPISEHACCDTDKQPNAPSFNKQSDKCGCSNYSTCDSVVQKNVTATLNPVPVFDTLAILPKTLELPVALSPIYEPGHFGNDSGPPASVPNHVSLGRAPPVFLA